MFDSWEQWVVAILVLWAVVHTFVDMQVKKKVDMMEKEMKAKKPAGM